MDFYSRQAAARRQSRWLFFALLAAIALVVAVLTIVTQWALGNTGAGGEPLDRRLVAGTALLWLALIAGASAYKSLLLRGGGGVVARSLGGTRVDRSTTDPLRRRLLNVVEEMSIASGVPVPEVYVLEAEGAINALAVGDTPANAAIAVTNGALQRLNREQLQGVIAHEFSHILNGDMRLNVRLLGWLFGLLVIAVIGRTILRLAPQRGARGRGAGAVIVLAVAMVVLGYAGLLCGRVIQAAVARHRERLADASAVQFTRNPEGLKGALLKIAGVDAGSKLRAAGAETVAHMLFAPGVSRLFATHPSLPERIKALDPYFDTRELERLAAQAALQGPQLSEPIEPRFVEHAAAIRVEPGVVAARVGNPEQTHLREARVLRRELQAVLRDARHSWISARAAVLSLVLAHATVNRTQQLRQIGAALGEAAAANVEELAVAWQSLPAPLRLPSAQILFVNLRSAPPEELARLRALLHELALADGTQDVFEFCLAELLAAALADLETARPPHGNRTLQQESAAIGRLFAVLASRGATAPIAARQAYEAGISRLLPRERPPFDPPPDWTRIASAALARLERLQPAAKHLLVEALVATIAHDGRLAVAEAELLRAICVRLQCPLPPLLERVSSADDAGALQPG